MKRFDYARLYRLIERELAADGRISDSMSRLVTACREERPHPDWDDLEGLAYDDVFPMVEWLTRVFREEPSSAALSGLWFGLFNPWVEGRVSGDIGVCGSTRFDRDSGNEWAVGAEWAPHGGDAQSTVLDAICATAHRDGGLGNEAEWPLTLGYGALVVRSVLESVTPTLILGPSERLGIAVGFNSGDHLLLGEFSEAGLHPYGATGERNSAS
jgi:hypothetical protein